MTSRATPGNACSQEEETDMGSTLWIIIVVLIVLAMLGYFGRGRLRR